MAPPKQGEPSQTSRQPRGRTRAQSQPQGSEQQPSQLPEVVNVDEIPSSDTTLGSPTPIEEETQQTTPVGMDIDMPEEGQGRQNEDAGNQVQPENPIEAPRVNGMTPNQEEMDHARRITDNHVRTTTGGSSGRCHWPTREVC
jgi:hypothetical protein